MSGGAITVLKWLAIVAACAAVLFGIVHGYELWRDAKVDEGDVRGAGRVQALWNKADIKTAADTVSKTTAAFNEGQRQATAANQGEKDALKKSLDRKTVALADAQRAADVAGGLSDHITALNAAANSLDLPTAAACPGELVRERAAAVRARNLLGACSSEYRAMGQRADVAFDGLTLKLDTALGYINAVAPVP